MQEFSLGEVSLWPFRNRSVEEHLEDEKCLSQSWVGGRKKQSRMSSAMR